jgi:predicted permease
MIFLITLGAVAILLATAVPGFVFVRKNMISEDCIPGFSKVLLFVCQPCLIIYPFISVEFSLEYLANLGIFAALIILVFAIMLGAAYLVMGKRCENPIYRIITIATTFSNCAFFGIPIIEEVLRDSADELIPYTTVFAVVMNIIGWTVGSAIISRNIKHISLKKSFINPAAIGFVLAMIVFITNVSLPESLANMITIIGKMSTPLSMIIMGMRLATMKLGKLFTDYRIYLTILVKQFVMPLVTFAIIMALPFIDVGVKKTLFITCACPIASVVLNFSELVGQGQAEAANSVLLSTMLSIITLPIMMLLLPFIA